MYGEKKTIKKCICSKEKALEVRSQGVLWKTSVILAFLLAFVYFGYLAFFTDSLLNPGRIRGAEIGLIIILLLDWLRRSYREVKSGHKLVCATRRPVVDFIGWLVSA